MNVEEVIAKLRKLPRDAKVRLWDPMEVREYNITDITLTPSNVVIFDSDPPKGRGYLTRGEL